MFVFTGDRQLQLQMPSLVPVSHPTHCSVQTSSDLPSMLSQCRLHFGCLVVVDMASLNDAPVAPCLSIHRFARQGHEACLLALVKNRQGGIYRLLQVGFYHVLPRTNVSDVAGIARRYWESLSWPPQNVTDLVISNLPWTPIE